MGKIFAGIGSRSTPADILLDMQWSATTLATEGWLLRSGGADGADTAFERGCDLAHGAKEIWLPWRRYNGSQSSLWLCPYTTQYDEAMRIAAAIHPAWHRCSGPAKMLHARNVLIVLGGDLATPCDRVIAWTPQAQLLGGTATALRLAMQRGIEIVNLGAST